MEISPISGIRALPALKAKSADVGPAAVFDIENFVRIDDETYSPGGGKSASGAEDEALEEEIEETEDGEEAGYAMRAADRKMVRKINYFA
jgi:hypothetical protein